MVHTITDLHVYVLVAMLMLHYKHHGADQQAAGWWRHASTCMVTHSTEFRARFTCRRLFPISGSKPMMPFPGASGGCASAFRSTGGLDPVAA